MKSKKIILFIVEGITDKMSLGGIIQKIVADKNVKFQIVEGDITTKRSVSINNIKKNITNIIKTFMDNKFCKEDILEVIHLVDMDGAYIDNNCIEQKDTKDFIYTTEKIYANKIDKVIQRNEQKQKILNTLIKTHKVFGKIDYSVYYFSCNLEHVLHDKINVEDNEKRRYANNFNDQYYNKPEKFIEFINDEKFKVKGNYNESWEFIKGNNNSLKRYSNFHLFINELKK